VVQHRAGPGLADGPAERGIEVGHHPRRCPIETREERLPALDVLAALGPDEAGHILAAGRVEGEQDRARLQVADPALGLGGGLVGTIRIGSRRAPVARPIPARHKRRRVDHDHGRPDPRVERLDHCRSKGVHVIDGEVSLAAGRPVVDPEDRAAQPTRRLAQAHALTQAQEQAGDVPVAEREGDAGPHALVALVHVLAAGTCSARVRMALGGLANGHQQREGMAPSPELGHAPIARPPVGVAPAATHIAVKAHPAARVARASRAEWRADRRDGFHNGIVVSRRDRSDGASGAPIPTQIKQGSEPLPSRPGAFPTCGKGLGVARAGSRCSLRSGNLASAPRTIVSSTPRTVADGP